MKKISYNCRVFINNRNQVVVRVRWNKKRSEVGLSTGMYADPLKWDENTQRPKRGSTHIINAEKIPSRAINERIDEFLEAIEKSFSEFAVNNVTPKTQDLRERVNEIIGRNKQKEAEEEPEVLKEKTLKEIFDEFLQSGEEERGWGDKIKYKYLQSWKHLNKCVPNITIDTLTKETMQKLKNWYIKEGYKNRTITNRFKTLKSFFRWMKVNGYNVTDGVLGYKHHLKVTEKNVVFLTFDELLMFYNYKFNDDQKTLEKARDLFCFMAFTSLRYSDLAQLKRANITTRGIEIYTKKTSDHITIDINHYAQELIDKYIVSADEFVFPVPTNQKLNQYLKLAAKECGLDREIIDTNNIGNQRIDKSNKLYEIISCHDARRTFVCCSLALGIPETTVMKWTGHKCYENMKPYIEVTDKTLKREMSKWDGYGIKNQIIDSIDKLPNEKLEQVYDFIKNIA